MWAPVLLYTLTLNVLLMHYVLTELPAANRRLIGDTVFLRKAQASNSAVYQCEASNKHGTILSNANIMIMSKYEVHANKDQRQS